MSFYFKPKFPSECSLDPPRQEDVQRSFFLEDQQSPHQRLAPENYRRRIQEILKRGFSGFKTKLIAG